MIQAKGLYRAFEGKVVLRGIDLDIRPGEAAVLLGPNGSGKTTLLRILATLLSPSKGDAWIGGHSVSQRPLAARASLGWAAASEGGFHPRLNGRENLHLFGALRGMDQVQVERALSSWPRIAPLEAALETPFALSSSGMKQILSIARALIGKPRAILLDEPTRSLDEETSQAVRVLLEGALQSPHSSSLLYSSHGADPIRPLARRELRLREGNLEVNAQ